VFYINDVLSMKRGEEVVGNFSIKPGRKNPRELEIGISYSFDGEYEKVKFSQNYSLR